MGWSGGQCIDEVLDDADIAPPAKPSAPEHEHHESGEEEVSFVLFLGGVNEEFVEFFGREEPLEDGSQEDGEG